jgi:hypothetical protein
VIEVGVGMADTRVQGIIENWVRYAWMPVEFGRGFEKKKCKLVSGGFFEFDAVSEDGAIVACISTSQCRTARGKHAVGKVMKLRSDMLWLSEAADVSRRLLVLTEEDMLDYCQKQRAAGRLPRCIELVGVPLPPDLAAQLVEARRNASVEVSPL